MYNTTTTTNNNNDYNINNKKKCRHRFAAEDNRVVHCSFLSEIEGANFISTLSGFANIG